jgi:hypothetical protein
MPSPGRKKNPEGRKAPDLIPEGEHPAIVIDAHEKPSQSSGRDMAVLKLEVTPADGGESKQITSWVVYEDEDGEQTSWCEAMIDALVVDGDPEALDPAMLIGRQCLAVIVHEEDTWRGRTRTREKIDYLKPHPEGAVIGGGGYQPQAAPVANEEQLPDDGLPF